MIRGLLTIGLVMIAGSVMADNLLMKRVPMKAEIAYAWVTASVEEHGYSIAHVQTCDVGMADFGYKSDFYRTVFIGKGDEVRAISAAHPEFTPYLPLKIAVVAEGDETVLTAMDPVTFSRFYPEDRGMQVQFQRWRSDILSMFKDVQKAADSQ